MIVQPTFHVPPDIAAALLSGDFIRHGGVVRDTAGRLVTHLTEIPTPEKAMEEVARRAAPSLKNPLVVVGVGALTLAAVGGGVVLALKKARKDTEPDVPQCVQSYKLSLQAYLQAVQSGSLDADIIDRLITDLGAVVAYGQEGDTTVAFSPEQLATLTKFVLEHTGELARMNAVELGTADASSEAGDGGVVVDLLRSLEAQRRIFGQAA